jgi:translation initiation factor 3 subunit B
LDEGLDNIIVVDGIPIIDKSKLDKLLDRIGKQFTKKNAPISVDDMFVPWNDQTKKNKG